MFRKMMSEAISKSWWRLVHVALVAVLTGFIFSIGAAATELPGLAAVNDLEMSGDFLFELAARNVDDAEIYLSEREVAYLVIAPELQTPLLISPRGKSVQSVRIESFTRKYGGAELAQGSALEYLGEYDVRGGEMIFELEGKIAKLKPKPPLLGQQTFAELERHDPRYAYNARSLREAKTAAAPAPPIAGESVKIRVYFGSWSEICEMLVPKVKQVEDAWNAYGVRFEYYGLPRPLIDDQHAVDMEIRGVPTAVVFVDDEEIGRANGLELNTPEESLHRILAALD